MTSGAVVTVAVLVLIVAPIVWGAGAWYAFRRVSSGLERTLGEPPGGTVWEWLFSLSSTSVSEIELTEQRAERGAIATHPMGSRTRHQWLDDLTWNLATFDPYALPTDPITTEAVLGPRCRRPLRLRLPVLPAPMGWGVALSRAAKIAIAEAATLAGTAATSGEGPFLPDERAAADRWILQASRAGWAHQAPVVCLADMVEIQLGQGSEGGGAVRRDADVLPRPARRAVDGAPKMVIHAGRVRALEPWIAEIRRINPDIPVGVKIPATPHVEGDVLALVEMGVDVVTLDGSEAATAHSPAVIHDHSGIPTGVAVRRADRALRRIGMRHRVSLVASGGLRGAADIAKALALGADAAALGTSVLFAACHRQISGLLPFNPPTDRVFAERGTPFDAAEGAERLGNWFLATREELKEIAGALGLAGLDRIGPEHLVAHNVEAARLFHLPSLGGGAEGLAALVDELTLAYGHAFGVLQDLRRWVPA